MDQQDMRSCLPWEAIREEIQLLARKLGTEESNSGDIAAWPTEAGNKTVLHRIL